MTISQKTVMIIEDEPDAAEMFAEMMRVNGLRVLKMFASTPSIPLLLQEKPDLVILDVMMPDISGLPSLTAYENIMIPMEIAGNSNARERADLLLGSVDLKNRGHHYPHELSGGEQQRVAIARAFANSPKILLADEPTGNLDSKNGGHIFDLMMQLHLQSHVTLVLVTHDRILAEQAQRRIVLSDGKLVTDELNITNYDLAADQ